MLSGASISARALLCALLTGPAWAHPGSGIVVGEGGDVFFTDNGGNRGIIWRIDAEGKLSPLHKGAWHWLLLDSKGSFARGEFKRWFEERKTPNLERIPLSGAGAALIQTDGCPIVLDRDGNLCYAKRNLEIARLSPDGKVTPIAPELSATTDKLGGIKGLASGRDGLLYIACPSAILTLQPGGKVETLVQPIVLEACDRDLPPGTPREQEPFLRGLAVDARGMVYAAATGCRSLLKIMPDGKVEISLQAERPWSPTGVAVKGEDVYVLEYTDANGADHDRWLPRVRKLARDGKVTTLAAITKEAGLEPGGRRGRESF